MGIRSCLNSAAHSPDSRTTYCSRAEPALRRFLLAVILSSLALCLPARAQTEEAPPANRELGASENALCGLLRAGVPTCPVKRVTVGLTTGYGYTESMGPVDGSHTRLSGVLAASYVPVKWIALALTLNGRLDMHPNDVLGKNRTATGEPSLIVRAGRVLPKGMSAGGELRLWFPGNDAPSFEPSAISADMKALFAWAPSKKRFGLIANIGFRMDNSANSAPDLRRVRPGDRIALGLSDSHSFLVALGAAHRVKDNYQVFGEVSADLLFGSEAPPIFDSPWRVSAGTRYFLPNRRFVGELSATALLSKRPGVSPTDPLVPIEPRFTINLGIRYNAWEPPPPTVAAAKEAEKPSALKTTDTITGLILDDTGAPLPEANIRIVGTDPEKAEKIAVTNGSGRYLLEDVPFGHVTLEASAVGFEAQTWEADVYAGMPEQPARTLVQETHEGGLLRGLIRSFGSTPLKAQITVLNKRGKQVAQETTDSQGRFEISLPEGKYRVVVKATGYKQHKGEIQISGNGVAILNVDMRQE